MKQEMKVSQYLSYGVEQWLPSGALLFGSGMLVGAVLAFTGIFAPVGIAISGVIEMAVMCGVAACVLGGPIVWYCDSDSEDSVADKVSNSSVETNDSYKSMMSSEFRKASNSAFETVSAEKPAVKKKVVVEQQAHALMSDDDMSLELNSISLKK